MAKSNASEMLTSLDSLFTTQEQRDEAKRDSVQDIPISQISDFPEHPFKVKQDEAMLEMAESVRQYGVLVPGLVRQLEDGSYQMVSGHRRKLASELAGRDTIPCIVRDLTDDEAVIIMVDSNLQRERVLPSEKAFAYKMKLDAMRSKQKHRPKGAKNMDMTYTMKGGYRLPDLLPPQEPETALGKYGLLRRKYLKEHRKVLFTNLLTSGKLNEHLAEIDRTARQRVEQTVTAMAQAEGVTEDLKAADPMKWVGLMNNLRNAAEETVLAELIYN